MSCLYIPYFMNAIELIKKTTEKVQAKLQTMMIRAGLLSVLW